MATVNYNRYINSKAWREKREAFFASGLHNSRRCYVCKKPRQKGWHVHHLTYERLGDESLGDLATVCPPCHERLHEFHDDLVNRQIGTRPTLKNSSKKIRKRHAAMLREEKRSKKSETDESLIQSLADYHGIPR